MKKQNNKRVLSFLLAFVLLLSMIPVTVFAVNGDVTLTVIHVNDRHGRMGADPYIAQLVKDTKGNVLVLDAGDALHGQITANLTKGAAMVELMNEVGYAAMAVGNHEFTYGVERITELAEMMDFPLLAANVKGADGKPLFAHHTLFNMKGLTVGVFGLATPETIEANDPRLMAGIEIDDPVKTSKAEVAELQAEGCDIIIALTHLGIEKDDALAAVPGIDVIIDGHSHTAYPNGLTAGNTLIAQAGEYGENIGVVEITVSGDKTTKTAKLIPVDETLADDAAITAKITELDAENEAYTSEVVGNTPVFLQGEKTAIRTGQSSLADLITDSMRKATGADMAFISGGNIRASIDAGDITMGEVLTTLPYSNLLTTVTLTGADIQKILEHGVASYPEAAATYIHVSGLRFTFDPEAAAGQRVATITMSDGTTLDPEKAYTVATIDFIAAGGDGYDMMLNGTDLTYYGGDAEAFIDYLKSQPAINAEPDNRASALAKDALYVVMPDATHGFLGESIRHAEDELKKLANKTGLAYKLFKTADAALQSEALDEAILANAGAVVLWPITGEPLRNAAQRVMDTDIPLIIYDRLIEDFTPVAEVLGDNMKIAKMAGAYFNDYFVEETASDKKINIIELAGDDSTVPKQRTQGFMEVAGAQVNVVHSFNTQWQREVAREQITKWLKTASKKEIESIQAIYSHEDETLLGAMDAIAAYNGPAEINIRLILGLGGKRDLVMHMGYFKEHFGIDLVTYQFSPAMVREAIQDGVRVLNGEAITAEHLIDTFEIDHDTLGAYLASDAYKTRYTTAMPKIDNVPVNAWYSFAVSSRAIEFYTSMIGGYDPDEAITAGYASQILASSLPYSVTVAGGSEMLTRQRFAGMLMDALVCYGIIETNGTPNYADADQIGSTYKKAVDYVYKTGLMRGVGGGKFDPEGLVTRSQAAAAMYNVVEACLKAAAAPQQ